MRNSRSVEECMLADRDILRAGYSMPGTTNAASPQVDWPGLNAGPACEQPSTEVQGARSTVLMWRELVQILSQLGYLADIPPLVVGIAGRIESFAMRMENSQQLGMLSQAGVALE